MKKILVIDDEKNVREVLRLLLADQYRVVGAENGAGGLEKMSAAPCDLVILDLLLPDMHGLEVLKKMREAGHEAPVIILSGLNEARSAVEAIKSGAVDYLVKPFEKENLRLVIRRALEMREMSAQVSYFRHLTREYRRPVLVGSSAQTGEVRSRAEIFAASDSPVLITGEAGSDKELVARLVHYGSQRREEPFVPVHCACLRDRELEKELFGREKPLADGQPAGLYRLAGRGTIFFQEIPELSPEAQALLVREAAKFADGPETACPRLVVSGPADLPGLVKRGLFREDLFYSLNTLEIAIVPLRKRTGDIVPLLRHFLEGFRRNMRCEIRRLTPAACRALCRHPWPGNERELKNFAERLVVFHGSKREIGPEEVAGCLGIFPGEGLKEAREGDSLVSALRRFEAALITGALSRAKGVRTRAARELKTTRRVLSYRMEKLGIRPDDY